MNKLSEYFLGANSPSGFVGYAEELQADPEIKKLYVLKGFSGSGKSTLLKKIVTKSQELGEKCQLIYCASDSNSLDGVILPERNIAIFDGTLPHPIEPKTWGLLEETVDLLPTLDTDALAEMSDEALKLFTLSREQHAVCCDYLAGAAAFLSHSRKLAMSATDKDKIIKTAATLAKLCGKATKDPTVRTRLLTAVTNNGVITLPTYSPVVFTIRDPFGASSSLLLDELSKILKKKGIGHTQCFHPLFPNKILEQIIVPQCGIAFVTESLLSRPAELPDRLISFRRFTDTAILKVHKKQLAANKKAALSLIEGAANAANAAYKYHVQVEKLYRPFVDYSITEKTTEKLMSKIFG